MGRVLEWGFVLLWVLLGVLAPVGAIVWRLVRLGSLLAVVGLAAVLAGCTSDAEWHARASMAASESAARQAEAFASSQADVATAAIWAMAWPVVLLIVGGVVFVVVGLIVWDRMHVRQTRLEAARLTLLAQAMQLPAPRAAASLLVEPPAPTRRGWQLAPGETPACMLPMPVPQNWEADR